MIRKRILILAFMLVILSFSVAARRVEDFSAEDAYDWLLQQSENGSYNGNIKDTSAAFLALDAAGGLATSEMNYLLSQENENHCWPKSSCKIDDTVWAVLALYKSGESSHVSDAESWLKNAQTPTLTSGNWWLEIDTPDSGTCTIKYKKGTTEVSKNIEVEAGTFPDCGGGTFFNLKNCLETGLLSSYASLELNVDCSALDSAKISIAYNSGSSYYLYEEVSENTATLTVKNGCFGTSYKSASCSYDASLHAEWILGQIASSLSSELYLRESYDSNNAVHNALLYLVTQDEDYATRLVSLQRTDGSWGDSLSTAFAVLALRQESGYSKNVEDAQEWLKTQQKTEGSWDDNVFTTSLVLYSSFYQGIGLPGCTDGVKNQGERGIDCGGPCELEPYSDNCCDNGLKDNGEEGIDCGGICDACAEVVCDDDGSCEEERGEDCNNCPDDCLSCETLCGDGARSSAAAEEGIDCGGWCGSLFGKSCEELVCNNDGNCEIDLVDKYGMSSNEDSQKCPDDCSCGDEICDDYERESGECPLDCPVSIEAKCGDGVCNEGEDVSCPEDCAEAVCNYDGVCDSDEGCDCSDCFEEDICKEERGIGFKWILIILIILALAGGAYFFFTKKKPKPEPSYGFGRGAAPLPKSEEPKKPGPKGSFFSDLFKPKQPVQQMPPLRRTLEAPKKSKLDEEIEQSIKEAKKLIKGEK